LHICISLSINLNLSFIYSIYFWGKYFEKVENGQNKCPKTQNLKQSSRNAWHDCIIDFYGVVTKKINFNLLR